MVVTLSISLASDALSKSAPMVQWKSINKHKSQTLMDVGGFFVQCERGFTVGLKLSDNVF